MRIQSSSKVVLAPVLFQGQVLKLVKRPNDGDRSAEHETLVGDQKGDSLSILESTNFAYWFSWV